MNPGGTVSNLSLSLLAPSLAGTYCLVYDLVQELVTWFSWQSSTTLTTAVTVSPYDVSWGSHDTPSTMTPSEWATVNLTFTNTGSLTWASGGPNPVQLSYHWLNGTCPGTTTDVWDGQRAALPADVSPGGTVSNLSLSLQAPSSAGTYCLVYDMVEELVTWFSWQSAPTLTATVTVAADP